MTWHIVPAVWIFAMIVYAFALIIATGGKQGRSMFWLGVILLAFLTGILVIAGWFG